MNTRTIPIRIFYSLALVSALFQSFSVYRRIDLGYGLTDEAFSIANSRQKLDSSSGMDSWPYADITSILFRIADENVILFRTFAALIIVGLCIACLLLIFLQRNSKKSSQLNLQAGVIFSLSLLTIPSCFRYLLVTPSYQWIILVTTSLVIILWRTRNQLRSNYFELSLNAILVILILIISISRLSSGVAVFCIILASFVIQKSGIRNIFSFTAFVFFGTIILLIKSESLIPRILETMKIARTIDPLGRNIFTEGLDVLRPSLIILYLLMIPLLIEYANNRILRLRSLDKKFLFALYILGALALYRIYFNDPQYITFFLTGILVGHLTKNIELRGLRLILISLLPVISQFGSNISASYLSGPLLMSCCGYYYLVDSFNGNYDKQNIILPKIQAAHIFMVVVMLAGSAQGWHNSYENGINSKIKKEDEVSSLKFSEDKYNAIIRFRAQVKSRESISDSRVFDLSFWHPGAILYLNKESMPYFLGNKFYSGTIAEQLALAIRGNQRYLEGGTYLVLVESRPGLVSSICQDLNFFIFDRGLQKALKAADFNPRMRLLGIYESSPEDSTLFPKNLAILETCS